MHSAQLQLGYTMQLNLVSSFNRYIHSQTLQPPANFYHKKFTINYKTYKIYTSTYLLYLP